VAADAVIASELVRTLMTIAAGVVKVSEVRPPVTVEAIGLGMSSCQSDRVYGKLRLTPTVDGRVAVAATESNGHIVRADVATAAVL
jgi:hypothetical protein